MSTVATVTGTATKGYKSRYEVKPYVRSEEFVNDTQDSTDDFHQRIEIIKTFTEKGDKSSALREYNSVVKDAYNLLNQEEYKYSRDQVRNMISDLYAIISDDGEDFTINITKNAKSPFVTGLIEGIPIVGLFCNGESDQEIASQSKGSELDTKYKVIETLGSVTSNMASAAAIGAGIGLIGGPAGAAVGAAVGAGVGLISGILKPIFKGNKI